MSLCYLNCSDSARSPSPSAWASAYNPSEPASERRLIGKSRPCDDIRNRNISRRQQCLRTIDPAFQKPAIRRDAETLPECVREVAHRKTALLRQLGKSYRPFEALPHHLGGALLLPRCQSASF